MTKMLIQVACPDCGETDVITIDMNKPIIVETVVLGCEHMIEFIFEVKETESKVILGGKDDKS